MAPTAFCSDHSFVQKTKRSALMTNDMQLPLIDFSPFLTGSSSEQNQVAREIGRACREVGFFSIVEHGVPLDLIEAVFQANRDFHRLPASKKEEILLTKSPNHRGYHPFQAESTDPNSDPDLKEAFDMALELPMDDPDVLAGKPFHGPNAWPRDMPGFRKTLMKYYEALVELGGHLCRCFAIDLGLTEDFFVDKHSKPLAQLRLLHYPEIKTTDHPQRAGAGEHTDYGSVAILSQDRVSGLEFQTQSGQWIPVDFVEGAFICNLGDMMEAWTNGLYRATPHRVHNNGRERYSQVLFFDPNFDCLIEPLEACCDGDRPPKYKPITMGRYLEETFDRTFAYRHRRDP